MTKVSTMYAWDRGEENKDRDKPKVVYILKGSAEVCFPDFVSSDRQATSFLWPNKSYLGEVYESSVSLECWDKMNQQERERWLTQVRGAK